MHDRIGKSKENESKTFTNSVAQKQSSKRSTFQFVDNRPEAIAQRKLRKAANNSPQVSQPRAFQVMVNGTSATKQMVRPGSNEVTDGNVTGGGAGIIQLKTMTVRNKTQAYSSGWVQAETQSTGVEDGPQDEAQSVAKIAGGSWVGGHMVNDRLGGGGGFDNIVPITSSMNNNHHPIENAAQEKVREGYEVRYRMYILKRQNCTFGKDSVNNLATEFQQHYDYRTKEVKAGGTRSRPIAHQPPGDVTTVDGKKLEM